MITDSNNIPAGPVPFNEDILIFTDQPRRELGRGNVQVFSAKGQDRAPPRLIAFICDPSVTPRVRRNSQYSAINNPHLLRLVASGPIPWGGGIERRYAFIYEDALTSPLLSGHDRTALGYKPESLTNTLIKPMVSALYDLQNTDLTHGAIRPQNMFGAYNDGVLEKFMLGDCLSLPPSYDQPVLYQTILRGMTDRGGRGPGTIADDLYSFGASLAVMMRQYDPMTGLSDDDIIHMKHEQGSFNSFMGKEHQNGPHIDLLRGLLQDDPALRWTVADVEGWLEGRRQSPKSGTRKKKAGRPLVVNTDKYIYPELLAKDVYKNPSECARLIDNGEVEQWIVRALEDNQTEVRFNKFKTYVEEESTKENRERYLLSGLSIVLHPEAPLRYDNIAVMPQGFGPDFSETVMKKGNIRPYLDIIQMRLVVHWLEMQEIGAPDISHIFSLFDGCRSYLSQTASGFGYERCLYELDHDCPCLSERLIAYGARSPEEVLAAFETIISKGEKPHRLFDRHITAFLMTRDRKNIEPYLHDMNSGGEQKRILGELQTLATIQKRTRSNLTPNLAKWFAEQGEAFLARIHDREERKKIAANMGDVAKSGDLIKIMMLIDDPKMKLADLAGFKRAMQEYRLLHDERQTLERELMTNPNFGRGMGRTAAAGMSLIVAFILICLTMLSHFSGGPGVF